VTAPISLSKQELMASVVETLGICGGRVPSQEEHFWREIATYLALTPRTRDLSRLAQTVIAELEEEWDDDFLDEENRLTVALYETLDDAARRYVGARAQGEIPEVEEDDDQGVGFRSDLHINPTSWSLQTVYEWIRDGRLELSPDWQRSFVWKSKKQKRLIESLLLGLPIPSFLIFQDSASGKKFVIDGRQRLETIARFKAPHETRGQPRLRFRTFGRNEPGWRDGEFLNDAAAKYYDQLPDRFKSSLDSAPLVLAEFRDISPSDLYQVFKRYNTGAVALNAAEIRNAVYQASPLHQVLFRLAGETRPAPRYLDEAEERASVDLRETMQNKTQRYGAYDFIGRYFAFAYQSAGSVAKATVGFMDQYANGSAEHIESLRQEFIRIFRAAQAWYVDFLIDPEGRRFHAFLATLQLVSTKVLLAHIAAGRTSEATVGEKIQERWGGFARNRLAKKQNSTLFWGSQKTWVSLLEEGIGIPRENRAYPSHPWREDLESAEAAV
jgi:hypothetical protein